MALVLGIDTSAKSVSCALARDQQVLGSFFSDTGLTHSQTLMKMVQDLLNISNVSLDQLDAIAVNAGPGSFTGVRIGVSAVKGLAFTHKTPCVSVSTLECMAENVAIPSDAVVCGTMDARCQQVYTALFAAGEVGLPQRITEDEAISISDLGEKLNTLKKPVILVGDGSAMCYRMLKETVPNLLLAPPVIRNQNAATTALIGVRRFLSGDTVSAEELLPIYLRLPQAERELNARLASK